MSDAMDAIQKAAHAAYEQAEETLETPFHDACLKAAVRAAFLAAAEEAEKKPYLTRDDVVNRRPASAKDWLRALLGGDHEQ